MAPKQFAAMLTDSLTPIQTKMDLLIGMLGAVARSGESANEKIDELISQSRLDHNEVLRHGKGIADHEERLGHLESDLLNGSSGEE